MELPKGSRVLKGSKPSVKLQSERTNPKSTTTSNMSSSEDEKANDAFTTRFELMEEIGSGSFGSVYKGLDRTTGQEVAIKMEKKTRGTLSSIATEIRYYEKLFESQDMDEKQNLQSKVQLGQPNVTMDLKCESSPFDGEESSDEREPNSIEEGSIVNGNVESDHRSEEKSESVGKEHKENDLLEDFSTCSLGIPKLIFSGIVGKKYVIVMEMLGPNLEKLFNTCNRRFSLKTVTQLALQALDRIEFIHSKGLLHRDIKPENFVIGKLEEPNLKIKNTLYIVDFGLSKCYLNPINGTHNPSVNGKELTGTARYVSLRTHNGEEQSRRDDIEAIGHMLIYFMRGSLPWQGLKMETQPGLDARAMNKLRYQKIAERKKGISVQELCSGIPVEFEHFLSYARYVIGYMDKPDYDYLRELFHGLREKHEYPDDWVYDWDRTEYGNELVHNRYQSLSNIKVRGSEANEQKVL